jgi:ribosomal protein S18
MDMKHAKVEVVQESVAVKPVKVTSKKTSKILEAQQLGYEVVNYKDQKILKRDGRYHGIVNEQNMILAQYPTDTVVELISSL